MNNDAVLEKKKEVSEAINILNNKELNVVQSVVLKSTIIMMLYNSVESTVTELLTYIHDEISSYPFSKLNRNIQNMMLDFFWSKKNTENIFDIFSDKEKFPSYDKYIEKINLFSGNLDARKINEICKKYGIGHLTNKKQNSLLEIKTKRNQLAHGEKLYKVACRDMTVYDIKKLIDAVYENLFELNNNVKKYIENKEFLCNNDKKAKII